MNPFLFIFIGGGLGSLARYGLGKLVQHQFISNFPYGTLAVNISASLVLGAFVGLELSKNLSPSFRAFIAIGFCGGFSTFSTFANDTLQLIQANRYTEAMINVLLNVSLCVIATFAGIWIMK